MSTVDDKASELARLLTMIQIAANRGIPALVLRFQAEQIQRVAGELAVELGKVPPTTPVHMNPELKPGALSLLQEYFHGRTVVPDTVPDELKDK